MIYEKDLDPKQREYALKTFFLHSDIVADILNL